MQQEEGRDCWIYQGKGKGKFLESMPIPELLTTWEAVALPSVAGKGLERVLQKPHPVALNGSRAGAQML